MRGPSKIGRILGHGDLRFIVLSLLEKSPRHGYEIIKEIEELSSKVYAPSPGIIYPTLTSLEESELASSITEKNKKKYSITQEGMNTLEANREGVDFILMKLIKVGKRMSQISSHEDSPIGKSMNALKSEILSLVDAKKSDLTHIASIIDRAVKDIQLYKEQEHGKK